MSTIDTTNIVGTSTGPVLVTEIQTQVEAAKTDIVALEGNDVFDPTADETISGEWDFTEGIKREGNQTGTTWRYKLANYTIKAGESIAVDPAGTARTVTLPATIAEGDAFKIHNLNTGALALVTIARNSHTLRYQGTDVADDVTIDEGETISLVCTSATNVEIV